MTQTKTKAKQAPTQSEILATIRAQFKDMKVDNTRLTMIEEQIKDLLEETEAVVGIDLDRETEAAERGQTIKYSEMEVISIIGPTGSTKSTSLERIVERWNKARPGEMPIVMVTIRASTRSEKQLQVQILEAFNDPQADVVRKSMGSYSPTLAIEAIRRIARSKRTFVVVLHEANNMIGQDEYATARPMAKAIKSLVNEGVFSVVVMGIRLTGCSRRIRSSTRGRSPTSIWIRSILATHRSATTSSSSLDRSTGRWSGMASSKRGSA